MANKNCASCDDLKNYAPDFITNGVTTNVCASLKNNTGLGSKSDHTNCEDLDDAVDCLLGNLRGEIDAYDDCDWKEFAKKVLYNAYNLEKAMACNECGQWSKLNDLCRLAEQSVYPYTLDYGILPLATGGRTQRRCGTMNSNAIVMMPDDGTLSVYTKEAQGIGINYYKMEVSSCSGANDTVYEWISPRHYYCKIKAGTPAGTVLWKVSKEEAQRVFGISDVLWTGFVQSSWMWTDSVLYESRQMAWLKITCGEHGLTNDELGVVYQGCTAPNNPLTVDNQMGAFNPSFARVYRHQK